MSSRKNTTNDWESSDEDDDDDNDEEDELIDEDEDDIQFFSICSSSSSSSTSTTPSFDSLALALKHDIANHGFDFLSHLPSANDEDGFFEGAIKLVNKCRQFVKDNEGLDGMELGERLNEYLNNSQPETSDDDEDDDMRYYKPVLGDDAMLMCIDDMQELKLTNERSNGAHQDGSAASSGDATKSSSDTDTATVKNLQNQVSLLEEQLARAKSCITSLANDDDGSLSDDSSASSDDDDDDDDDVKKPTTAKSSKKQSKRKKKNSPDNDTYYFSSYSNTGIHETMLRDTIRTAAYEEAILSNSDSLFRGKTVLDIGCGTGVLSLFCAKAGAKKVIAVDNSDILTQAEEIVKLNGYENVVTCVKGKIETLIETKALPLEDGETVDIIVSEWMGYALFFETMLPSVMVARDAVMTPVTGSMYPNVSKIFIEGGNSADRLDYWDNVHSLNMAPMKERMVNELTQDALVEVVGDKNIVTNRAMLIEHDLNTCKHEELDFEATFELSLREKENDVVCDVMEIHHLVVSFDIDFSVPGSNVVSFSTGCQSTPTHWKQAVLWFDPLHNCPTLNRKDGEVMRGRFRMKRNAKNHRAIDMAAIWETGKVGSDGNWVRSKDGVLKRSLIA